MQKSPSIFRWHDRPWAALLFFTRLPFWRMYQPPVQCYASVVEWWPLTGWLTAGTMAAVLYLSSMVMPYSIAVMLAIIARILLTGALHEDGLADFLDGFGGGGSDRQRILTIMKDSHIGTYGVLGLILYITLLFMCLFNLSPLMAAATILAADPFAKMLGAQTTQMMPYARTEETAKNRTVYRHMSMSASVSLSIQGLLPMGIYIYLFHHFLEWTWLLAVPCLTMYILYLYVWRRLRGYTGDCCGAFFLLIELSIYLAVNSQL